MQARLPGSKLFPFTVKLLIVMSLPVRVGGGVGVGLVGPLEEGAQAAVQLLLSG